MSEVRNLICIRCPMGCALKVALEDGEVTGVTGNSCPRGAEYGRNEVAHPMRTVTSTVKVVGGIRPVVSCKTAQEIPKEKIYEVMRAINAAKVTAPVNIGDVIVSDVAGTGSDLVATAKVALANPANKK